MTEEEIKKFAKEYVQNNTDESVNSFIGEQLQKAFIEGTDFMYYSNNEELRRQLTEKDKQIAELKRERETINPCGDWNSDVHMCQMYVTHDEIQDYCHEIAELKVQIEKMKCCQNCKFEDNDCIEEPCSACTRCLGDIKRKGNSDKWEIKEND